MPAPNDTLHTVLTLMIGVWIGTGLGVFILALLKGGAQQDIYQRGFSVGHDAGYNEGWNKAVTATEEHAKRVAA